MTEEENTDVEGTALDFDAPPEDSVLDQQGNPNKGIIRIGKLTLDEKRQCTDDEIKAKREFWSQQLTKFQIRYVVAPMVDQSELAFRMFMRKHGAQLTFTPMIHAHLFVNDATYRRNALSFCKSDRPLIVQFCANKPETFLDACRLVETYCDGVDLNLGCPQMVAKRGHYGAYLQDEIDLICEMVDKVRNYCRLPISCKIRIRESSQQTINYARRLVDAGACMLSVHGRTREMKGANTGVADWGRIKEIVDAVDVPVIANGNIQMAGDVERCIKETGAAAVMSAEGILYNPLLFKGGCLENWKLARDYLEHAKRFQAGVSAIRAHIFRICHHSMLEYPDLRKKLGVVFRISDFEEVITTLKQRIDCLLLDPITQMHFQNSEQLFVDIREGNQLMLPQLIANTPHWLVKPYFRSAQIAKEKYDDEGSGPTYKEKRKLELKELAEKYGLSLKQVRKRERRAISMERKFQKMVKYTPCNRCKQPSGQGCSHTRCKKCCRLMCKSNTIDCKAHRYKFSM